MQTRWAAVLSMIFASGGWLAAEVRDYVPKGCVTSFSHAYPPALRIEPGDVVRTRALDAFGGDETGRKVCTASANPLTGPFYVKGAEPGDAVAITLRRVRLNRDWGWSNNRLMPGALVQADRKSLYPTSYKMDLVHPGKDNLVPWSIDTRKAVVRLREPVSARSRMEFPARPMIGCIGVAAEGDAAPTTSPSGPYGGNVDSNGVAEGVTVLLPVFHGGALIFFGDGHALQGDGELLGTGIETSLDIEFAVAVHKNANLLGPRLVSREEVTSIGSQPEFRSSLDTALQMATSDMLRWLTGQYALEPWATHMLIAMHSRYRVVTLAGSMALSIPKAVLPRPAESR